MKPRALIVALLLFALGSSVHATTVLEMSMPDLTRRAHDIVRGEVIDVDSGSVSIGGGAFPTVTYTIRVEESFRRGTAVAQAADSSGSTVQPQQKDPDVIQLTMLDSSKLRERRVGDLVSRPALPHMPRLAVGERYLLWTTRPSAYGLCAPVGLQQGAFRIVTDDGREMAVNELGHSSSYQQLRSRLFRTMRRLERKSR